MGTELGWPGTRLVELDRHECLERLGSVPVGRIVYTEMALPAVQLVNFALTGETIVIRTARGSKLAAAARHAVVAFETDRYDEPAGIGWSVTAVGPSRVAEDPDEIAFLATLPLRPWAPGRRDHFILISAERLTGRRIDRAG